MISLIFYIGVGLLGGILSGLLGLGGGLIVVPCLALHFAFIGFRPEILMHLAVGSSLAAMITTTSFSTWSHLRQGAKIWPTFRLMAGGIVMGTLFGAVVADFVHSVVLSVAFGGFAILFSFQSFFVDWLKREGEPKAKVTIGSSFLIGTVSSLLGIGAGSLGLPFLTSYERLTMHRAVAVSAALSLIVSIFGTISYLLTGSFEDNLPPWTTGYLYWPAIVGVSLGSPLTAWGAAILAHRLPVNRLKQIFAVILFIIGVRMLFF